MSCKAQNHAFKPDLQKLRFDAVTQGLRYTEDKALGATFFIPALVVPVLLVPHYIVFIILLSGNSKNNYG